MTMSVFTDTYAAKAYTAYDTKAKTYRHMNFFEHECHLHVRVPRIECYFNGVTHSGFERTNFIIFCIYFVMIIGNKILYQTTQHSH
jgi:hypothetical protein